jgi:hypothetical protein
MRALARRLSARLLQFRLELEYVAAGVQALVCCLYHLPRRATDGAGAGPLVLVDRDSVRHCLEVLGTAGVMGPFDVHVLRAFPAVDALLAELEAAAPPRTVVLSRLLYAKYYMRFQPLKSAGTLVVA